MEKGEIKYFDFGNSALIESSAGTGKTFTITLWYCDFFWVKRKLMEKSGLLI